MISKYSSISKRVIATSIDFILISVILTPFMQVLERFIYKDKNILKIIEEISSDIQSDTIDSGLLIDKLVEYNFFLKYISIQIIFFAISGIILVFLWKNCTGMTPGKWLLGCKIISNSEQPITYKQCFARYIGYFISTMPLFLGIFLSIFDSKKRCWHDRISNTYVCQLNHDFTLFEKIRDKIKKIFK